MTRFLLKCIVVLALVALSNAQEHQAEETATPVVPGWHWEIPSIANIIPPGLSQAANQQAPEGFHTAAYENEYPTFNDYETSDNNLEEKKEEQEVLEFPNNAQHLEYKQSQAAGEEDTEEHLTSDVENAIKLKLKLEASSEHEQEQQESEEKSAETTGVKEPKRKRYGRTLRRSAFFAECEEQAPEFQQQCMKMKSIQLFTSMMEAKMSIAQNQLQALRSYLDSLSTPEMLGASSRDPRLAMRLRTINVIGEKLENRIKAKMQELSFGLKTLESGDLEGLQKLRAAYRARRLQRGGQRRMMNRFRAPVLDRTQLPLTQIPTESSN